LPCGFTPACLRVCHRGGGAGAPAGPLDPEPVDRSAGSGSPLPDSHPPGAHGCEYPRDHHLCRLRSSTGGLPVFRRSPGGAAADGGGGGVSPAAAASLGFAVFQTIINLLFVDLVLYLAGERSTLWVSFRPGTEESRW